MEFRRGQTLGSAIACPLHTVTPTHQNTPNTTQHQRTRQISIPQGHGDLCDIPSQLVFPLGSMKFKGVGVSTPGDVHGALRYRYGSDYMVPK